MKRKRYSSKFKATVALEAIRGLRTINEIASEHGIHPNQISQWKKKALESLPDLLTSNHRRSQESEAQLKDRLYQQIGQLQVELEWLKKKTGYDI